MGIVDERAAHGDLIAAWKDLGRDERFRLDQDFPALYRSLTRLVEVIQSGEEDPDTSGLPDAGLYSKALDTPSPNLIRDVAGVFPRNPDQDDVTGFVTSPDEHEETLERLRSTSRTE